MISAILAAVLAMSTPGAADDLVGVSVLELGVESRAGLAQAYKKKLAEGATRAERLEAIKELFNLAAEGHFAHDEYHAAIKDAMRKRPKADEFVRQAA